MKIDAQVTINGSKEAIWTVLTEIEKWSETISGIEKIEILHRPEDGLVGLKWRETRTMFGKTATEEMWITEATENESYTTRAESHGMIYITTHVIAGEGNEHSLHLIFDGQPQGFLSRLVAVPMGIAFKGATKKMILQDLEDVKAEVERQRGDQPGRADDAPRPA